MPNLKCEFTPNHFLAALKLVSRIEKKYGAALKYHPLVKKEKKRKEQKIERLTKVKQICRTRA